MIHTVKGFGIVNKAEIEVFLELSYFFDDPANVGNLISGSSAFFILLVILPFKITCKLSTEVLFTIPKCKKVAMCLHDKMLVLLFRHGS